MSPEQANFQSPTSAGPVLSRDRPLAQFAAGHNIFKAASPKESGSVF